MPIGLDYSPGEFQQRRGKNWLSNSYDDYDDQAPRQVALDKNNSASSWQIQNFRWRQDADQSGYYSEDSELDSISVTSVSISKVNTAQEGWDRVQEGTFDHHPNKKFTLLKLNNDSNTNDLWIWLADAYRYIIKKGTAVVRMVSPNEVPKMVVTDGAVGTLWTQGLAKEGHIKFTVEERRKILFKKLEFSGLKSWTEEDKERALDLLAEYHDIFTLEDGEMGCTEATKHKIEVTDLKPFKERPRNIPSGLLEKVKDHPEHMLDVGTIKPTKLAWSNAVVLVQKKDGGLRFCIDI